MRPRRQKEGVNLKEKTSCEEKLEVNFIDCYKGSGVFAVEDIAKGNLLTWYVGEIISHEDGMRRHTQYSEKDGSFLFFFKFKKKKLCMDATHSAGFGRMINDDHKKPNCKVVVEDNDGRPSLTIYSIRQITKGEEICFNYQDSSVPWRKEQLRNLTKKCGGCYSPVFDSHTTHVIMETAESGSRICERTIKYFMGIAHHCWVLSHEYVEKSLEAGYYLPEEEYEIQGDRIFPSDCGAQRSRMFKADLFQGVKFTFTGDGECFKKVEAEKMVCSLGGQLDIKGTHVVSLEEKGDNNTLNTYWLFDSLSLFKCLDTNEYINGDLSMDGEVESSTKVNDLNDAGTVTHDDLDFDQGTSRDQTTVSTPNLPNDPQPQGCQHGRKQSTVIITGPSFAKLENNHDVGHEKESFAVVGGNEIQSSDIEQEQSENHGGILTTCENKFENFVSNCNNDIARAKSEDFKQSVETDKHHMIVMDIVEDTDQLKDAGGFKKEENACNLLTHLHNTEPDKDDDDIFEEVELTAIIDSINMKDMSGNDSDSLIEIDIPIPTSKTSTINAVQQDATVIPGQTIPLTKTNELEKYETSDNDDQDDMADKDYIPGTSSESESEGSDISDVIEVQRTCEKEDDNRKPETEKEKSSDRNKDIYVSVSTKYKDGSRKWDKRHMCVYCKKTYPGKLPRHFESMHKNELAVQRALAYDKGSKNRKRAWKEITNQGDFENNLKVYEAGVGEIIPCKRPRIVTKGTQFVQCKECKGTYMRSSLWRHVKSAHPEKKGRNHQVDSASLMPVSAIANQGFREKILDKMTNDTVSIVARTDNDIVTFGQRQFIKHARNSHQFNYVRQKMRELSRFLIEARVVDCSIQTLRDCIDAVKFPVCVTAVKNLCGYDNSNMLFGIPSLANKIGHSLHKVARRVKLSAMATGDEDLEVKAKRFIEMYKEDYKIDVGHTAFETMEIAKYNKPSQIPLADDLKTLSVYLKEQANTIMGMSELTHVQWRDLSEITLAQTVLFNKRRAGEAERLQVQQYLDGIDHGKTTNQEVFESLSPLERKLAEVINRVEVRGKRGRRVAILLQDHIVKQFDALIKYRSSGNIDPSNVFMFARPGTSETPIRATDVLRKFASICGAKQPQTLTSTGFRKHVATVSQMLNLKENELDVVASFLGHDIRVHREFYRLPCDTIQVAKVSKLLLELERGHLNKYKGKTLDEIQFNLDEPLEEESDPTLEDQEEPDNASESNQIEVSKKIEVPARNLYVQNRKTNNTTSKKPWSEEECAAVCRQLGTFLYVEKLPGKYQITEAQKKEPLLMLRPWTQIKFFIKNKKNSYEKKNAIS
ncbi:hypothetical protein ACF0H5_006161 [Mactra antiquata]